MLLKVLDNSATGVEHKLISCSHCCPGSNNIVGIGYCGIARSVIKVFARPVSSKTNTIRLTLNSDDTTRPTQIRNSTFVIPAILKVEITLVFFVLRISVVFDPLKRNKRFELKGIFQGAKVERGPDWRKRNEDVAVS